MHTERKKLCIEFIVNTRFFFRSWNFLQQQVKIWKKHRTPGNWECHIYQYQWCGKLRYILSCRYYITQESRWMCRTLLHQCLHYRLSQDIWTSSTKGYHSNHWNHHEKWGGVKMVWEFCWLKCRYLCFQPFKLYYISMNCRKWVEGMSVYEWDFISCRRFECGSRSRPESGSSKLRSLSRCPVLSNQPLELVKIPRLVPGKSKSHLLWACAWGFSRIWNLLQKWALSLPRPMPPPGLI